MNRKHSLNLLKLACVLTALMGVALFFFVAPAVVMDYASHREPRFWIDLIYIWIVGALSFAALGQAWKICVEIGRDNSFSQKNARSLFRICLLALTMAALLAAGVAALCLLGMGLPALLIAMLGFAAACALVALLANALSQLVRRAAAIKSENDLTI